jgi:hypothetical protein
LSAFAKSKSLKSKSSRIDRLKEEAGEHWKAFLFGSGLLLLGVVGGYVLEDYAFTTSFYIIVQIVTTIGYGDLTVTYGHKTKILMALYALALLVLGGYYFSLFCEKAQRESRKRIQHQLMSLSKHPTQVSYYANTLHRLRAITRNPKAMDVMWAGMWFCLAVLFGTVFFRVFEHCSCSYGRSMVHGCDERTFETCRDTGGHVKTWIDTFYMSVITVLTIGFGDHSPQSEVGRLIGSFWMLFGVGATANFVSAISSCMEAHQEGVMFEDALYTCKYAFNKIDTDGSGTLDHGEFLSFMLVHHGLVKPEVMDQLNDMFFEIAGGSHRSATLGELMEYDSMSHVPRTFIHHKKQHDRHEASPCDDKHAA